MNASSAVVCELFGTLRSVAVHSHRNAMPKGELESASASGKTVADAAGVTIVALDAGGELATILNAL